MELKECSLRFVDQNRLGTDMMILELLIQIYCNLKHNKFQCPISEICRDYETQRTTSSRRKIMGQRLSSISLELLGSRSIIVKGKVCQSQFPDFSKLRWILMCTRSISIPRKSVLLLIRSISSQLLSKNYDTKEELVLGQHRGPQQQEKYPLTLACLSITFQ